MSVDKEFLLIALLQHNYFPMQKKHREELPPIFSSVGLTEEVAEKIKDLKYRGGNGNPSGYDQIDYQATRFNNVPRTLSIPHPKAYIDLCYALVDNWEHFDYIQNNENSLIKPHNHSDGRVIIMDYEQSWAKMKRALKMGFGQKFIVHTDISGCFPSIYSHAIPWALVDFKTAKSKSSPKWKDEWFNQIDRAQRYLKRNETQGTAIGPATSNIISECILSRVDAEMIKEFQYVRFIDDYTCYCERYEDAENFIRRLSQELAKYKLNLNYKKTKIRPLPVQVNTDWVNDLNTHLPSSEKYTFSQVIDYLDYALELQKKHNEGSVLKYAIKTIRKRADNNAKEYLLEYTLTLAMHYPVLIPVLQKSVEENGDFTYGEQLQALLKKGIEERQSDSMCWIMYYLLVIDCAISRETAQDIIATEDCMSITVLYLFKEHQDLILEYAKTIVKEDLWCKDQYWILLYALFFDDKIGNPFANDDTFKILKEADVKFMIQKETV
jgi:hypothetical protein